MPNTLSNFACLESKHGVVLLLLHSCLRFLPVFPMQTSSSIFLVFTEVSCHQTQVIFFSLDFYCSRPPKHSIPPLHCHVLATFAIKEYGFYSSETLSHKSIICRQERVQLADFKISQRSQVCSGRVCPITTDLLYIHVDQTHSLLHNPTYSDLNVCCKDRKWQCHRAILSSRCPFFKTACSGQFLVGSQSSACPRTMRSS